MNQTVETPYLKIWHRENFLHCVYADDLVVDLTVAQLCVAERIRFSKGKSYAVFVDMRGIKMVHKDAREHLAKEGSELVLAGALLINSPLSRALGNIFLTINKPRVPCRLFTDESNAIEWLRQFIEQSDAH
jgi:hypothetical protein